METRCPLCKLPRPRGAKRCICNYTFEYDTRVPDAPRGKQRFEWTMWPLAMAAAACVYVILQPAIAATHHDYTSGGIVIGLCGVFTVVASYFGWRWYMATRKAQRLVWLFGHRGARGVMMVLGGALAGAGLAMAI